MRDNSRGIWLRHTEAKSIQSIQDLLLIEKLWWYDTILYII